MKINLDIDVTPEELRRFFGLPDLTPLHAEMLEALRRNMQVGVAGLDPASLMKAWLPLPGSPLEGMQKGLWDAFIRQPGGPAPGDKNG